MKVSLAIIGGSGVYEPTWSKNLQTVKITTPFGFPSAPIEIGSFSNVKIAFLARHGKKHTIPPHLVNSRANLWALKKLGVERIIGICAVGSLQKSYKPGEIVIPDQFIDWTKKREYTFCNQGKVFHLSLADPFCPFLRNLFYREAKKLKIPIHKKGTYLCIEGPRFSTRAESKMFRNFAEIIGMTLVPEAQLARELEICYLSLSMITDYDVRQKKPVNAKEILKVMAKNSAILKKLLEKAIPKIPLERSCPCQEALQNAGV